MKICEETVRKALDQAVGSETLSQWDRQRIVRTAEMMARRRGPRWPRRVAAAAATMALMLVCTTGAMAAVPGLAETLGMLSKKTVQYLRPVDAECEASGIKAEVIAAMNDGDTAVAYIGLQDTTGRNRLDETTAAPDCMLTDPDWYTTVDNVYHKQDGTVVLRVVAQSCRPQQAESKVSLNMDHLLSGGQTRYGLDTGYTVAEIMALNAAPKLNTGAPVASYDLTASGDSRLLQKLESGTFRTLKPIDAQNAYVDERAPWLAVLNAGVVDNVLHILVQRDEQSWYNDLWFDFADEHGNRLNANSAVLYLGEQLPLGRAAVAEYSRYQEYLLELPKDSDPAGLHLVCDLNSYAVCVQDNWNLTFTLEENDDVIEATCDLDMKPWRLTGVQLSPVGVTLSGSGSYLEDSLMPEVQILLADGIVISHESFGAASSSVSYQPDGDELILQKYLFEQPLDLDTVQAIGINGLIVWTR